MEMKRVTTMVVSHQGEVYDVEDYEDNEDDEDAEDGDEESDTLLGEPTSARSAFFLNIVQKGGGGQTHVQKICCKFCMILKAFWQHKIDIKRLFKGRNVSIWGYNVYILG